jgi:hypothetical protein
MADAPGTERRAGKSQLAIEGERNVLKCQTNSQVLSADGQVLFRQVIVNGVLCWQAGTGRTFPVVAGAEDPPGGTNTDPSTEDDEQDSPDNYDRERGFRKIQAQAADLKKLRAEREALRAQAKELDALKADQKKREDAEKSESDRLKDQLAEAERKRTETERELLQTRTRQAIERAASKAGAADPEDVFRLLDQSEFDVDDATGKLTNADKLVDALLKAKPYLKGKSDEPHARGNGAGPKPAGNTGAYSEVVKSEEARLRKTGAFNL